MFPETVVVERQPGLCGYIPSAVEMWAFVT